MSDPKQAPQPSGWDLEAILLRLIAEAGEARGLVYEALEQALAGEVEAGRRTLAQADEHLRAAHAIQFQELIAREAAGEEVPISLLVIHGMDLVMTTSSERDLANAILRTASDPSRVSSARNGEEA